MTAEERDLHGVRRRMGTVRRMPEKTAYRSFDAIARSALEAASGGVAQLEEPGASRARCVISTPGLSRQSTRNCFRYWCDAFRMPDWSNER